MSYIETGIGVDPRKSVNEELKRLLKEKFAEEEYHNPEHSAEVDVNSFAISSKIREIDPGLVSDQQELGREAAANGHDAIIEYIDAISGDLAGQRIIRRGFLAMDMSLESAAQGVGNEKASADKIVELINEADPHHAIYKDEAITEVYAAVAATYPTFEFSKFPEDKWAEIDERAKKYFDEEGKGLRIYQPHLTFESSVTTLSVGLADLSYAGLLPVEESVAKGDAEYRESRDKTTYLIKLGISKIPDEEKLAIIADMKKWIKCQIQFFSWRKVETERIIDEHKFKTTSERQRKIKEMFGASGMFDRFNQVISTSINRAEKCETEAFKSLNIQDQLVALAKEFGYDF